MFSSTVTVANDPFADESDSNIFYHTIAQLTEIRSSCAYFFASGGWSLKWADHGLLAFSRVASNLEAVVTINFSSSMNRFLPNLQLGDEVSGDSSTAESKLPIGTTFVNILNPKQTGTLLEDMVLKFNSVKLNGAFYFLTMKSL